MSRQREVAEADRELALTFPHLGDVRRDREIAKNKALLAAGQTHHGPVVRGRRTWVIGNGTVVLYVTGGEWCFHLGDYNPETSMISDVFYGAQWNTNRYGVLIANRLHVKLDLFSMTTDVKLTKSEVVRLEVCKAIRSGEMSPLSDLATRINIKAFWISGETWEYMLDTFVTRSVAALKAGENPRFNLDEKLYIGWRMMLEHDETDYYPMSAYAQIEYERSRGFDKGDPLTYNEKLLTGPYDIYFRCRYKQWVHNSLKSRCGYDKFETYLKEHYQHFTERRTLRPDGTPRFHNTPETLFPFWAKIAAEQEARKPEQETGSASKRLRVSGLIYV